jgi:hypothetical protein
MKQNSHIDGNINNILEDSFIKGIQNGGYLDNDTITQQDIINRIKMSGGENHEDSNSEDSDDSDNSDDSENLNESDKSESSDESESESESEKKETETNDDSDSDLNSDSVESNENKDNLDGGRKKSKDDSSESSESSDSSSSSSSDTDSESDNEIKYKTGHNISRVKKNNDSVSSSIIISSDKSVSVTPYMLSESSLKTDDINLVSFSPKKKSPIKKASRSKKSKK